MLTEILVPYVNLAPLILRLALSIILIRHGWPKLFGTNPGLKGFAGWLGSLGFPLPMFWALVVALLEVVGGAALALGFLTQWVALLVAIQFAVIMLLVKIKKPFSENEIDLIIFATALALVILGGGSISLFNPK
ncbi:MAG: DoxX family protein [Candidatus Azambacteria bacterium]|nr:DoxX family protein [Candidatus Azambacteria bacterium]